MFQHVSTIFHQILKELLSWVMRCALLGLAAGVDVRVTSDHPLSRWRHSEHLPSFLETQQEDVSN